MHLDALAEGVSQADVLDGQSQEMVLRYPERFWEWIKPIVPVGRRSP